jgi:hypothetical protein
MGLGQNDGRDEITYHGRDDEITDSDIYERILILIVP